MLKIKRETGNLSVSLPFTKPVTRPQDLAATFFEMIVGVLNPEYRVSPSELSGSGGVSKLSEVYAKYNLYGGPNAIALFVDRLSFEFVGLRDDDFPIAYDVMGKVHNAFPEAFPEIDFDRTESTSYVHYRADPPQDVSKFLDQFQSYMAANPVSAFGDHIAEPIARYNFVAADQSWRCKFGVERSHAIANGIFVDISMTFNGQSKEVTFEEKLGRAIDMASAVRVVLGLEVE